MDSSVHTPDAAPVGLPVQPAPNNVKAPKNWFLRLFSNGSSGRPKAGREALPGLVAYFFTGGVPTPYRVRDISRTGLYIHTREGWYPGTIVRITLTDQRNPTAERSIIVNARAVSSEDDGVRLQFILQADALAEGVSRTEIKQFLALLKSNKA